MISENENKLIECLDEKLKPYSFERIGLSSFPQTLPILAVWKRKTWNTNRAVAVISLPESNGHSGEFAQNVKKPLGKLIGYVPILYPLGLQIVLTGNSIINMKDNLEKFIDKFDNQRVVLQSIHVVDFASMENVSAHTWGQYTTGRFQNAIESGILSFLNKTKTG